MTPQFISSLIQAELIAVPDLTNAFGLDLTQCLIEPFEETYVLDNSEQIELWTVLRDDPKNYQYCIFFDEEENMFGLGMKSTKGAPTNIGYHGGFLKTLYSM